MPRGFLAGLVLGGVTGGAALAVVSLTAPMTRSERPVEPASVEQATPVEVAPVEAPVLPSEPQPLVAPNSAPAPVAPDVVADAPPEALPTVQPVPDLPEADDAAEITPAPVLPPSEVAEKAEEPEVDARPVPGLASPVEGVMTDRLPRIGDKAAEAGEAKPAAALTQYARKFANPSGRPPFALLLLDDGSVDLSLLELAAQVKFPLTLVIDPTGKNVAERAALWRAADQEVAILARDLPASAQLSDAEVAIEALTSQIPEALALVAPPGGGVLQTDRATAAAFVPGLEARGLGLVTWDQGLNSGDQIARREGLPAAVIYRDLNGKGEAGPVITRYLDRAAFKAQQDGRAVVMGRLDAEIVSQLVEWSLVGRAASLSLAPLSAVLK